MNMAMLELVDEIPFRKWGPGTGVINQCHDAITLEVPEGEAESVAATLTRCMSRIHPGLPGVEFLGEAAIGRTWKDV
jgi:DNA polymerase I-like protein with 3'-5' exonuclease and polymerase domains